jgi:phosphoribosylamine--glycine ligase
MKILVLGSGGREHAIVWKLRQSPRVKKLYCAPGNGGIAADAECVAADLKSLDSLVQLASRLNPDVTVVGPELPLTLGVVDEFQRRGWPVFGPTRAAAQLESSKSFAKEFMQRHRIPTAKYSVCSNQEEVREALKLWSRWWRRKTTSASSTTIRARIPAAWAPIRPTRWSMTRCATGW